MKISSVEILENYFVLEVMHPLGSTLVRILEYPKDTSVIRGPTLHQYLRVGI